MESTCCGNGCNNCVLDKLVKPIDLTKVHNVVSNDYQWWKVTDIRRETDFVFILEFQFHSGNCEGGDRLNRGLYIPPGAHLMMRLAKDIDSEEVNPVFNKIDLSGYHKRRQKVEEPSSNDPDTLLDYRSRPYTPYEYNSDELKFRILFRYEGGEMSKRIIRLRLGEQVEWKGFYGDFGYRRNMARSLICISQGVAISPMVNVIKSILNDELDETRVQLISCFEKEILLKEILRDFQQFWNFKLTVCLPHFQHLCGEIKSCDCQSKLRTFNEEFILEKLTERVIKSSINFTLPGSHFLISGSGEFSESISVILRSLGINPVNIFVF